jgi:hypothetical protein
MDKGDAPSQAIFNINLRGAFAVELAEARARRRIDGSAHLMTNR